MSLTRQDVEKVALLARLRFDDAELDKITEHMVQIVQYVDKLSELNTEEVEPMAHALDIHNALAEDELRPSLLRDEVLKNAPKHDGEYFLVPAVLGE
ncbi:MAG: Asp-tRNA(Asn)/Glu-tRNA(Gln) amidotransferase subunit GatC [Pirellulales bacterium]|jgi:aspartyl-tRNA(Asn)/glutamyl-tRNA(Gln) amidotransferase subunit C|nr:Asp-tRNA(Asn)/Glu-tRNA(Gln) amidotransferase GatCAB subunit C [Rhodopirellula sp.]MCH2370443.1 Asp-tRNA(Asn)/Glu-tRNA(Gln) amidotransferase subunit GatC [Pirellulales bacterium]HCK41531.1 Asp-tRNA(Asn)/Glu-tRNA(Gln) amidotransferase GatCAB subunit C [Planctomycetaceae bacterium]|tara:strand:- start:578 stop:868 length:291 start_codon:yes stop_codon:yes gene_type:complete